MRKYLVNIISIHSYQHSPAYPHSCNTRSPQFCSAVFGRSSDVEVVINGVLSLRMFSPEGISSKINPFENSKICIFYKYLSVVTSCSQELYIKCFLTKSPCAVLSDEISQSLKLWSLIKYFRSGFTCIDFFIYPITLKQKFSFSINHTKYIKFSA